MTDPAALRTDASALLPELVALRRTLHAHPEAGFALPGRSAPCSTPSTGSVWR